MRVAVMQPTYLPWLGYFDLMDQVDTWVVLDDVQFAKQSWQQRNRIKTPTGLLWLTVPVARRFGQRICDAEVSDPAFGEQHLASIDNYYRRCPHYEPVRAALAEVLAGCVSNGAPLRLDALNLALIDYARRCFGITTPMLRASQLGCEGKRGELVAALCAKVGAREYLSPPGAREYLARDAAAFAQRRIEVRFHVYEHPVYPQRFPPFAPYAAFVDLLFNCASDAAACLRSGRRPSQSVEEAALAAGAA